MTKAGAFDPRLVPARDDIAADFLEGKVSARRFVPGRAMSVAAPFADLRSMPRGDEGLGTQLLHGEEFMVYDVREGWAWGQARRDSYVGYTPADALMPKTAWPTHVVAAPQSLVFPLPDLKHTPLMSLSLGARVCVVSEDAHFGRLSTGGFMALAHLVPLDSVEPDYVRLAERLIGVPYLWGGRTSGGVDCSGLVQLVLQRAGIEVPRDSDLQEQALGTALSDGAELRRGDLVFWDGHVGLMADSTRLVHANAFHMAVGIEPLAVARARIKAAGLGVSSIRRLGA